MGLKITGFGGIALHVGNFKRAVAFYRDVLGLDVEVVAPGHFAQIPAVNIALLGVGGRVTSGGFHIELAVDDVDAWHKRLTELGAKVTSEPTDQPWGTRDFYVEDPDGHELELQSPVKRRRRRAESA